MYATFVLKSGSIVPFPLDANCVAWIGYETPVKLTIIQALKPVGCSASRILQCLKLNGGDPDFMKALNELQKHTGGQPLEWNVCEGARYLPVDKGAAGQWASFSLTLKDGNVVDAPDSTVGRLISAPLGQSIPSLPLTDLTATIAQLTGRAVATP